MESAAQPLARLTAAELGADRQDFSVHTAGAVTGFVPNAGAVQDRTYVTK